MGQHLLSVTQNHCMSYLTQLISVAIGGTIVVYATASWGLPATEVARIAKAATVKIESDTSQGSGEIVQQQGSQYIVLTAAHVVKDRRIKYTAIAVDNRRYQLTPAAIQILPGVDLAIVRFNSERRYLVPKLGDASASTEGTTTYVSGFPSGTEAIDLSIFSFTDGKITANSSRPLKDGYALIYSNNTLPGMSGGGVFNDRGELIAIHGKGDVDTKIQTSELNPNIRIKTGFNLGIPINTFMQLAAKIGLNMGTKTIVARNIPIKADDYILSGFDRVAKADFSGSVVEFTKALQLNPKSLTAQFWRGACKLLMGESQAAIVDLSAAIAINPKKVEAYVYRGSAYAKLGNKIQATIDLDTAVSLSPHSDFVYGNRCALKFQLGNFTEAISDCDRAIQLNITNAVHYSSRSSAYYQLKRYPDALRDRNTAISLDRNLPQAYYYGGLIKTAMGDKRGAIIDLQAAAKLYLDRKDTQKYQQTLKKIAELQQSK
jgi:tetratricopeptide (TPR) repeat protein